MDEFITGEAIGRLGDALIIMTRDGAFLYANSAALELYGYSADEIAGLHLSDIRGPRFREHVPAAFRGTDGLPRTFETEHIRKDGSHFPAEVRSIEVPDGESSVVLVAVRDITDRREVEESQRFSDLRSDNIAATIQESFAESIIEAVRACAALASASDSQWRHRAVDSGLHVG